MKNEQVLREFRAYVVWDAPTRWFHWINVLCVIALACIGLVILNAGALDVSNKGKILLKTLHVWIGYAFALNLGVRIVWAFRGNRYARWRQMLPIGKGYFEALRCYVTGLSTGRAESYLGHNPLGRLAIALLLVLMIVQTLTGLFLAGSDLYFPPLGQWIAQWIAAPGVDPASLVPYSPEMYDKASYTAMRAMREPYALVHLYGFYLLAAVVVIHVTGVVVTEIREGGGLVSAMFSGRKVLSGTPVDAPEAKSD